MAETFSYLSAKRDLQDLFVNLVYFAPNLIFYIHIKLLLAFNYEESLQVFPWKKILWAWQT